MSNVPFGFGKSSGDDDDQPRMDFSGADNPFAAMFGNDPNALAAAFTQLGQMMSWTGGPVNWDLAKDIARKTVAAAGPDPTVSEAARREVDEAIRLAELWLDPVTTLPTSGAAALAWSRAEWVEATVPVWRALVDPVAAKVVGSMGEALPPEMAVAAGPLAGMMRQMGGAMFGAQVGQALGTLAGEVLGATDIGLPLGPAGRPALVAANVAAFSEGLGVPPGEVRLYLALREAAHQRLFAGVPWLRGHVLTAVETYAAGIGIDMSRIESIVADLDPTNPEAISRALSDGMFTPEQTPTQQAALARLETLLALVEGWVDEVVHAAAIEHLSPGSANALRESLRRRRAAGGPAEQTFGNLVGLELRPRRLREAAALWQELREARGIEGRDAVWEHPDLLPSGPDLDDPSAFVNPVELDLGALLDEPDADDT
ncbi:MAG: zinc-dependent metalloprotease [Sporichthyaceae bacterium]